ncbi:transcriptional regulator [Paenibacillus helianthi]|uniref:Transcriptional regulator n=1 Tax=Paenibacillus helianthi TaxID=1349432 RepID=A0ABX3EQ08_9BACL|nr:MULTISPECIES: MarR family transcriptional regulator [Paenibacillus]OKP82447.1 transcriptional regulator [Paenibacillus sp. P3E]OKP84613.1 transcriptional regulator [Paenibacillus sp. P32E]OKP86932.1 transcriptional regulator [Paenibacillus helianthi]
MKREPIGKLISQLHRQHQKWLVKELLPYGIGSGGQHSFLKLILSHPGITQDQMTSEMKFDKATTARSVKMLEEAGYIERRTDPKDRRSSLLYPTAKALEFAPVLQSVLAELNRKLTLDFTADEVDQLVILLQKVYKNSENL